MFLINIFKKLKITYYFSEFLIVYFNKTKCCISREISEIALDQQGQWGSKQPIFPKMPLPCPAQPAFVMATAASLCATDQLGAKPLRSFTYSECSFSQK